MLNFLNYTKESSKYHLISVMLSIIGLLMALYLIYYQINFPTYVVVFVVLILLNTTIALYYSSIGL